MVENQPGQPLFSSESFPAFGSPSSKISSAKVHFAPPFCENGWSFGKKTFDSSDFCLHDLLSESPRDTFFFICDEKSRSLVS